MTEKKTIHIRTFRTEMNQGELIECGTIQRAVTTRDLPRIRCLGCCSAEHLPSTVITPTVEIDGRIWEVKGDTTNRLFVTLPHGTQLPRDLASEPLERPVPEPNRDRVIDLVSSLLSALARNPSVIEAMERPKSVREAYHNLRGIFRR